MTPAQRHASQAVRGWTYWLDYQHADWKDNGTEQAAEIMVWALSDTPTLISEIADQRCDDLHTAYVALTDREPLHGLQRSCADGAPKVTRS